MAIADHPSLTPVTGADLNDFTTNAGAIFGAGGLGATVPGVSYAYKTSADGVVTSATLTLSITSATAHWAGAGFSDGTPNSAPSGPELVAIRRVEALNKAHEQKHIDSSKAVFASKKTQLEAKMVGKTPDQLDAISAEMMAALIAACETLHSTEGLIQTSGSGSSIQIQVLPAGPGGCAFS